MKFLAARVVALVAVTVIALSAFAQDKPYIIGPADVLSVTIFAGGKTQEALYLPVSHKGTINFPFLGEVEAAGLSVSELTENMRGPLAEDYFVNPQVLIAVKDYKSMRVYLTGAVNKSGAFPLDSSTTTLLELIAKAGGVTEDRSNYAYILKGSINDVDEKTEIGELVQKKNSIKVNLRELLDLGMADRNIRLQSGDVVYIPSSSSSDLTRYNIYVLGKVKSPGVYDFRDGLTALDACILAGGFDKYAAPNRSTITRREADGTQEVIEINLNSVRKGKDKDIALKPGDRIFVPESWL